MREPSEYVAEIERIIGDRSPGDERIEAEFSFSTPAEARAMVKRLDLMQKELRLLKKEVRADLAEIHGLYVAQRSSVQAGFFSSVIGGRSGAARDRERKRKESKSSQAQLSAGHEHVSAIIDKLVFQLDNQKLRADLFIKESPRERPVDPRPRSGGSLRTDLGEAMRTLKKLLDEGLITQEEFDAKKADLLARI